MLVSDLVEVVLPDSDAFLKLKETLTRMGVASRKENTLYQSCHIFHRQGKYYIVMFKEMFALDGKPSNITDEDIGRRNTIIALLEDWGLLSVVDKTKIESPRVAMNKVKVIPFKDKADWKLASKYQIGKKS